ncbi:hypothetical protein QUF90_19260 [Desulfococcaceae bacterium HSG9]|nr:hypothetical protein [Desulfococcaceae bacterium HSG9]
MSSVLKALQRLDKQRSIPKRPDLNTVDAPTIIRRQARQNHRYKRRRFISLIVLVIGIGVLFAMAKTMIQNDRPDVADTSPRKTVARISELTIVPEMEKPASSSAHPQKPAVPISRADSPTAPVKKSGIQKPAVPIARTDSPTAPVKKSGIQKPVAPISRTDAPMAPVKKKVLAGKKPLAAFKPAPLSRTIPKLDRMKSPVRKTEKASSQKIKTIPQRKDVRKSKVTSKSTKPVTPFPSPPETAIPDKQIKPPKRENVKVKSSQALSEAPKELNLKLQAITWLSNPEKRFTVINDSIIRLGGMVDGFRLIRIEKDQVTVEKDNQKWLLKFNHINYSNVTP